MRPHYLGRILTAAVIGISGLVSQAHAAQVDFESITPDFFADGQSFAENGYTLTVNGDFGVVDTAAAFFIALAPSGNETQFYAGLNDSRVTLRRTDSGYFRLDAFDAAFIAPVLQDPDVVAGRVQVDAIDLLGNAVSGSFEFAASGADGSFPFLTYSGAGLSPFNFLRSATFDACVYEDDACLHPFQNLGQFALDNVNVTAVPEPSTYALMALGFAALAARARRATPR